MPLAISVAVSFNPLFGSFGWQPYHSRIRKMSPLRVDRYMQLRSRTSEPSDFAHQPTEKGFEDPQSNAGLIDHEAGMINGRTLWMFESHRSSNMPPATMSHEPSSHAFLSASDRHDARSLSR